MWSTALPKSLQDRNKHNVYNPSKSRSYKPLRGETWSITYGDGSNTSGTVGTDTLNLGGLVVKRQGIEMASKLSESFATGAGDGLLGLAWVNPLSDLTHVIAVVDTVTSLHSTQSRHIKSIHPCRT